MPGIYEAQRALRPRRSAFNLSYEKKLTCDLGQLIPTMCDEVVPGDTFSIGLEAVVRWLPMVAPILHEISLFVHYFFVPFRLLWSDWESFITGGVDGQDAHTLPTWIPTHGDVTNDNGAVVKDNGVGSLWDYFGFPVTDAGIIPAGAYPSAFTRRAYNLVFNQYYRDETQDAEISLDSVLVMNRRWRKDYFTSMLPWQQRGIAGALPVSISGSVSFPAPVTSLNPDHGTVAVVVPTVKQTGADSNLYLNKLESGAANWDTMGNVKLLAGTASSLSNFQNWLAGNTLSASATTFNVADLRLAFQIQKWQERNARGGARYIEFLQQHYGVSPRDERLQRAEYIGGTRMPVIVSEVLQTSETGATPQGTMAGHGLVAGQDYCAKYTAQEFGLILGVMSIMPKPAYSQGINRQWLRETRYDFYSPEWAHLSEQAVLLRELWATNTDGTGAGQNRRVVGYQGRYNEMRSKDSMTCGLMRFGVTGSFGFWHLARNFSSEPALNPSFLKCIPRKDYLAAPTQPACIVNIANVIKAIRPLPIEADPGLIDHS